MRNSLRLLFLVTAASAGRAQNAVPTTLALPPFDAAHRLQWFAKTSFGPSSQATTLASAGWGTLHDKPAEYSTNWDGFGERYRLRLGDRAVSTALEAGLGSLWGEDPRYFRVPQKPVRGRIGNVLRMTVTSHFSSGEEKPAWARIIAVPSAAFLSNTWRPDSVNSTGNAFGRIALSFSTRILGNALAEFWPDIRRRARRHSAVPALVTKPTAGTPIPGEIR